MARWGRETRRDLGAGENPGAIHLRKKVISNFRCCQAKATVCDPINILMTLVREVFIVKRAWSKARKNNQKQA